MSLLTKSYKPYSVSRIGGTTGAKGDVAITGRYFKGFFQSVSGDSTFKETKSGEQYTTRLYTSYQASLLKGDTITDVDGDEYTVVFVPKPNGISGFNKHNEILLRTFK
jgi:hypothetical protein